MNIDTLIQIFIEADDFFIQFGPKIMEIRLNAATKRCRNRSSKLLHSEIMTIYIAFHLSHYTNFEAFYKEYVCIHWKDLFP